jgi:hypothetical protein
MALSALRVNWQLADVLAARDEEWQRGKQIRSDRNGSTCPQQTIQQLPVKLARREILRAARSQLGGLRSADGCGRRVQRQCKGYQRVSRGMRVAFRFFLE